MSEIKSGSLTTVEQAALIPSVAMCRFEGKSEAKIADELKISRRQVRHILELEAYDAFLKDLQDQAMRHALAGFRRNLDSIAPLAFKALKANLEDGKLEAVKLYMQIVGGLKVEDKAEQAQSINIVVPEGLLSKPTIVV